MKSSFQQEGKDYHLTAIVITNACAQNTLKRSEVKKTCKSSNKIFNIFEQMYNM